jgi:hypothetical protein
MSDGVQDGMRHYDIEIPRAGLKAFKMFGTVLAGTKRFLYTIKYICSNSHCPTSPICCDVAQRRPAPGG